MPPPARLAAEGARHVDVPRAEVEQVTAAGGVLHHELGWGWGAVHFFSEGISKGWESVGLVQSHELTD